MKKRFLSFILIFCFTAAVMPASVSADTGAETAIKEDEMYPFYEDFETAELPSEVVIQSLNPSSSADIYTEKGNKVLKIDHQGGATMLDFVLPKTLTDGEYIIEYKFKNVLHGTYVSDMMAVINNAGEYITNPGMWYTIYCNRDSGPPIIPANLMASEWFPVKIKFDIKSGNIDWYLDGNYATTLSALTTTKNIYALRFACDSYGKGGDTAYLGSAGMSGYLSGKGVYLIDDIKIEKVGLKPINSNIEKGSENVSINKNIEIEFNETIDADTFNKDTVKILKNDEEISGYTVSPTGKKLTVYITDMMDYSSEYKVVLKEGAKASDSNLYVPKNYILTYFKTESMLKNIGIEDNAIYTTPFTLSINPGTGIEFDLLLSKNGEKSEEISNESPLEEGTYVLTVNATKDGKTEARKYSFVVVRPVAPIATDVKISGKSVVGSQITASYEYSDNNINDKEKDSIYIWKRLNKSSNKYEIILDEKEKPITGISYTLTDNDIDTYIKFAVIPKSDNEPNSDTEYESEEFAGPFHPTAENVKIENDGKVLNLKYDFKDVNGFEKGDCKVLWYRSKTPDGQKELINNIDGSPYTLESYTLSEADTECYIFASVTPEKTEEPKIGKETFADYLPGFFKPEVKNVSIMGNAEFGSPVGAKYEYFDINGDIQGDTVVEWYLNNNKVSQGESIEITSDMAEKTLYFVVTPVSTQYPYNGNPVKSESIKIKSKGTNQSSGFSGGGGGGSSYKPSADVSNNNTTNDSTQEDSAVFKDIKGHWAENDIIAAYNKKIINGVNDSEFAPDKYITRAEMAAVLARGLSLTSEEDSNYMDVLSDAWYKSAINAVSQPGYMVGFEGNFRPGDYITREELCTIAMRIIPENKLVSDEGLKSEFEDSNEISDWARENVKKAVASGLMLGRGNNIFAPKATVTRAECVTLFLRILKFTEV